MNKLLTSYLINTLLILIISYLILVIIPNGIINNPKGLLWIIYNKLFTHQDNINTCNQVNTQVVNNEEYSSDVKKNIYYTHTNFDNRIAQMRKEVNVEKITPTTLFITPDKHEIAEELIKTTSEVFVTPLEERTTGVIYNISPDEEIPNLYDDSDVEIITPEYEKFVEDRAFKHPPNPKQNRWS